MNNQQKSCQSNVAEASHREQGFTILQMVVAIAIVSIVVTFGVMGISRAQSDLALAGAMRQFSGYLEKGRVEAIRRHTTATVVTINSSSSYTVALDKDYDGTIDAGETTTVTLPSGMTFNAANITAYPATISFDSRGRSSFSNITGSTITMRNSYGKTNNIVMSGSGDLTLDTTVTAPASNTNLNAVTTVTTTSNVKTLNSSSYY